MSITALPQPIRFAGLPVEAWAFAVRIWLAVILALYVSFWLELDSPSTAAVTVAILALPTRGEGLDKAVFRLMATTLGVLASLVIVAVFAQSDMILLWVFAGWIGLCVFTGGMLDGNRAYAAALGVITVAIVAIGRIDAPQQVFEGGIARGSAIAVGVLAVTFVNDVLGAPERHPRIAARLRSLQERVANYGRAVAGGQAMPSATAAALLGEITALRPDIAGLVAESSSGRARRAAARTAMVELVAQFSTARWLEALAGQASSRSGDDTAAMAREALWAEWRQREVDLRRDLDDLKDARFPSRTWRAPLYRSPRIALAGGIRAALCFGLAATLFVMSDWPAVSTVLVFVAVLLGLGATVPDMAAFSRLAVLIAPVACILAGLLEFVVLDGATGFPMLAIGLAPFVLACALLMTLANPALVSVGRLNLVFILALVAPTNPETYDPETFLFSCLFVSLATLLLFAFQLILPPMSRGRQVRQLLAEARREMARPPTEWRADLAGEEAAFRDALRVGQIAGLAGGDPGPLNEAMRSFDQATALRRCVDELNSREARPFAEAVQAARGALWQRDPAAMLEAATAFRAGASARNVPPPSACAALVAAAITLSEKVPSPPAGAGT